MRRGSPAVPRGRHFGLTGVSSVKSANVASTIWCVECSTNKLRVTSSENGIGSSDFQFFPSKLYDVVTDSPLRVNRKNSGLAGSASALTCMPPVPLYLDRYQTS